jgi:Ca-activated chloride channel family protein
MVVLDGSGSMRGRVDGERKILAAKRVLGELIDSWDETDDLGLMAYGHRRTRDCSDIEILVPVSQFSASRLRSAVENVTAKGKTPLSEAVRRAAESLNHDTQSGTVILITDGLETCNADPCALGKQLAASGINFRTHVIGFDLAGRNTAALQCLANETGTGQDGHRG